MTFSTFATTVASMMIVSLAVDSTSGAQQWKQVRDILDGALALPPPRRRAGVRSELRAGKFRDRGGPLDLGAKTGFRSFVLPGRAVIEAQTTALLQALRTQNGAAIAPASQALSVSILRPAAEMLTGERVLVVADGALQRVPFSMLPVGAKGEPLVVTHETISYHRRRRLRYCGRNRRRDDTDTVDCDVRRPSVHRGGSLDADAPTFSGRQCSATALHAPGGRADR